MQPSSKERNLIYILIGKVNSDKMLCKYILKLKCSNFCYLRILPVLDKYCNFACKELPLAHKTYVYLNLWDSSPYFKDYTSPQGRIVCLYFPNYKTCFKGVQKYNNKKASMLVMYFSSKAPHCVNFS